MKRIREVILADRDTVHLMFAPDPGPELVTITRSYYDDLRAAAQPAPAGDRDGELVFRHQLSLSPDELGRLIRSCEVAADVWDDSGDVEELEAVQELVLRLRKSEVLVS